MCKENKRYATAKDIILSGVSIDEVTGCWNWTRSRNTTRLPYGVAWYNGKHEYAHRVSFMVLSNYPQVTDIPSGVCVLHRCDNPSCVNPAHLFLGTNQDNIDDKVAKGRSGKGKRINVGKNNGMSKLTDSDVVEVLRLSHKLNMKGIDIAITFSISPALVSDILSGKRWKHVTRPNEPDHRSGNQGG